MMNLTTHLAMYHIVSGTSGAILHMYSIIRCKGTLWFEHVPQQTSIEQQDATWTHELVTSTTPSLARALPEQVNRDHNTMIWSVKGNIYMVIGHCSKVYQTTRSTYDWKRVTEVNMLPHHEVTLHPIRSCNLISQPECVQANAWKAATRP